MLSSKSKLDYFSYFSGLLISLYKVGIICLIKFASKNNQSLESFKWNWAEKTFDCWGFFESVLVIIIPYMFYI